MCADAFAGRLHEILGRRQSQSQTGIGGPGRPRRHGDHLDPRPECGPGISQLAHDRLAEQLRGDGLPLLHHPAPPDAALGHQRPISPHQAARGRHVHALLPAGSDRPQRLLRPKQQLLHLDRRRRGALPVVPRKAVSEQHGRHLAALLGRRHRAGQRRHPRVHGVPSQERIPAQQPEQRHQDAPLERQRTHLERPRDHLPRHDLGALGRTALLGRDPRLLHQRRPQPARRPTDRATRSTRTRCPCRFS